MHGAAVELFLGGNLAHMAQEHYADAVRNKVDDRKIMPDEEIGQAILLLQVLEQVQHLALHRNIQCGDRFIADDQVRLQRNGAGNADALALAAAELVRVTVQKLCWYTNSLHQFQHAVGGFGFGFAYMIGFQRFGNDIPHLHARVKAGIRVLKDHLHPAAQGGKFLILHGGDVLPLKGHAAPGCGQHADQGASQGAFAAAALPHQGQRFAAVQGQIHIGQGMDGLVFFAGFKVFINTFCLQKNFVFYLAH